MTLELKAADNFLWRIEYRGDFSNQDVFTDRHGLLQVQPALDLVRPALLVQHEVVTAGPEMGRAAQPGVSYVGHRVAPRSEADRPMSDVDAGSLDKSNAPPAGLPATAGGGAPRAVRRHPARSRRARGARAILRTLRRTPPPHPGRGAADRARPGRDRRDRRLRPAAAVPAFRHRPPHPLRRPSGHGRRAAAPRHPAPALGSRPRGRPPGPGDRRVRPARGRQPRVPHGAGRRAAGRRRPRALSTASKPRSTTPAPTRTSSAR